MTRNDGGLIPRASGLITIVSPDAATAERCLLSSGAIRLGGSPMSTSTSVSPQPSRSLASSANATSVMSHGSHLLV